MHMFFQFKDDNKYYFIDRDSRKDYEVIADNLGISETKERQEKEWVKCENPEAIKELELCVLPSLYELRKL